MATNKRVYEECNYANRDLQKIVQFVRYHAIMKNGHYYAD